MQTKSNVGIPTAEPGTVIQNKVYDATIERMFGSSSSEFFSQYWNKRPLYIPGACMNFADIYDVDDFLTDLVATHPAPYKGVSAHVGVRDFTLHPTIAELRTAIADGAVASMKLNRFWHGPAVPREWTTFRALFGSLSKAVMMLYMGPSRSEDVDLFLAGPHSQLGSHYDTTHVFTVQIFGERKWQVDNEVHLNDVIGLLRQPGWNPAKEVEHPGATSEFTLRAGDAFYVPAYAVHKVTGVSWSVSLSLGLRAFNEIDVVEHLIDMIRATKFPDYRPLVALPETQGEAVIEAKLELIQRVRKLLKDIEMAAIGQILAPLNLPTTLDSASDSGSSVEHA